MPVVCVTGTPGVGKTTVAGLVSEKLGTDKFEFVNLGDLIREKQLYTEWDDEMDCSILDEDLVEDEIRRIVSQQKQSGKKGLLIDFHSVGFLPRRLVHRVVVVRADTDVLWARLEKRGYSVEKIQENVQAEIFMESKTEAEDQFGEEKVIEKINNTEKERDEIVACICQLLNEDSHESDETDSDDYDSEEDESNSDLD